MIYTLSSLFSICTYCKLHVYQMWGSVLAYMQQLQGVVTLAVM